jgi:predicted kinase
MRPPLVLTGGPAVGKSSTARLLARSRPRAAVIDVDDVRHMVVGGHAAPWEGEDGRHQQRLGVENACSLARNFVAHDIETVIADVITPDTMLLYRRWLPNALVIRLQVTMSEARRRAMSRTVYLTDEEFETLHLEDAHHPPAADHHVDVSGHDINEQVAAIAALWKHCPEAAR